MSRRAHLVVAVALFVTGCAPIREPNRFLGKLWRLEVGPQYQRPAVDTPDDFRGQVSDKRTSDRKPSSLVWARPAPPWSSAR